MYPGVTLFLGHKLRQLFSCRAVFQGLGLCTMFPKILLVTIWPDRERRRGQRPETGEAVILFCWMNIFWHRIHGNPNHFLLINIRVGKG